MKQLFFVLEQAHHPFHLAGVRFPQFWKAMRTGPLSFSVRPLDRQKMAGSLSPSCRWTISPYSDGFDPRCRAASGTGSICTHNYPAQPVVIHMYIAAIPLSFIVSLQLLKNSGSRRGRSILTGVECRRATDGLLLLGNCDRSVPRSCCWQTRQSIS